MNPKVSVLMPVYNSEKYVAQSIQSVLDQSFSNFEIIVVNDGSNDNSQKIIESFSDSRIKLFNIEHVGLIQTLNFGLKNCSGEFVARMDADDICAIDRLEKQVDYLDLNKKMAMCGTWATIIDQDNSEIGELKYPPIKYSDIKKYLILHNPFIHSSVMIRKEVLNKVGGYRNFKRNEDYELWTRIVSKYECENIPEFLIQYRQHSNQITKKLNLRMRSVGIVVRILAIFRLFF